MSGLPTRSSSGQINSCLLKRVVPAEVRKFGTRARSVATAPSLVPEDIPDFLKRPSMAREPSDDSER